MQELVKCQVVNYAPPGQIKLQSHIAPIDAPISVEEAVDIGQTPWPYKWPEEKKKLTWKFLTWTTDMNKQYYQMRTFAVVFRTISWIIKKKFEYESDPDVDTDITIEFTKDLSVFGNRESVIAQAYLFSPHSSYNGITQWNDNFFFTPYGEPLPAHLVDPENYPEFDPGNPMLATMPLLHVGMHEMKHMMGYRHDLNSPESILYPWAKQGWRNGKPNPAAYIWTSDDILRWVQGYEARNFAARWLNYFRARRLRGRRIPGVPYLVAV